MWKEHILLDLSCGLLYKTFNFARVYWSQKNLLINISEAGHQVDWLSCEYRFMYFQRKFSILNPFDRFGQKFLFENKDNYLRFKLRTSQFVTQLDVLSIDKVHIFWGGLKIWQNFLLSFDGHLECTLRKIDWKKENNFLLFLVALGFWVHKPSILVIKYVRPKFP